MHAMDASDSDLFDRDTLDRHRRALGSLARRLVGDATAAEDLVQSTFVRALEHPPASGPGIGAWLRSVLRNEARQAARADARRAGRERAVARDPTGSVGAEPTDVAARFDAQWLLMNAVRALEAPHREVILLRFFEDLPPRRIAARLDVPVKTIESRIQRALARLRAELDATHRGDRRAWIASIVPLSRQFAPESAVLASWSGVFTVKAFVVTGIAIVGLVAAALWSRDESMVTTPIEPRGGSAHAASAPPTVGADRPAVRDVVPAENAADPDAPVPSGDAADGAVVEQTGRLVDPEGAPLAGVRLRALGQDALAEPLAVITDRDGRFVLRGWGTSRAIHCDDDDYVLLGDVEYSVDPAAKSAPELVVVGAHVARLEAIAVDDQGRPIDGADLVVRTQDRVRALLGRDAARTRLKEYSAVSDSEGRFSLARIPAMRGLLASASKPGFVADAKEIDTTGHGETRFVLRSTAQAAAVLEGVVYDSLGAPFPGVRVGFGGSPATTDATGRFRFEYDASAAPDRLVAAAKGLLPAVLERPAGGASWPPSVELRIADPSRSIAGNVYDERGDPLTRATVWIAEATPLAAWEHGIWTLENTVRGGGPYRIEAISDASGRFRIDGLLDQEYLLLARDPTRAWIVEAGRFRGGDENVAIRFPPGGLRTIRGRVVDHRGDGVAEVWVAVQCRMLAATSASGMKYYDTALGSSATTDADGRFELADVPIRDASLVVNREDLLEGADFALPAEDDLEPLVLVVSLRCEVRVEGDAAEFAILDGEGKVLSLVRNDLQAVSTIERAALFDGRSEVVGVSDAARWVELYDAKGNPTRREVRLVPGQLNVLK